MDPVSSAPTVLWAESQPILNADPIPIPIPSFLAKIRATHLPQSTCPIPNPSHPVHPNPQPLYLPPPTVPSPDEDLIPPENFALVSSGVYRAGFPKKRNFRFMETLRLKTVLYVLIPFVRRLEKGKGRLTF